jgi:LPXTG-motif cell wall-anchored protein
MTSACAAPTGSSDSGETTTTTTPLDGFQLPETGSSTNVIAILSAILVLTGAGAVFATRSRKA